MLLDTTMSTHASLAIISAQRENEHLFCQQRPSYMLKGMIYRRHAHRAPTCQKKNTKTKNEVRGTRYVRSSSGDQPSVKSTQMADTRGPATR